MDKSLIISLKTGIRERVKERLAALNISARQAGIRAGLGPEGVRNFLREDLDDTKNLPRLDTIVKLCEALDCPPAWLSFGGDSQSESHESSWRIDVKLKLQAGVWRAEKTDLPDNLGEIAIPPQKGLLKSTLYGAVVEGLSMNLVYPPGTIIVFETVIDRPDEVKAGARYHIERSSADGLVENTIKTVERDASGRLWLVPESSEPEFRAPIPAVAQPGGDMFYVGRAVCALIPANN